MLNTGCYADHLRVQSVGSLDLAPTLSPKVRINRQILGPRLQPGVRLHLLRVSPSRMPRRGMLRHALEQRRGEVFKTAA